MTKAGTLIFLHLPKAAGATVLQLLRREYTKEAVHVLAPRGLAAALAAFQGLPVDVRGGFRAVHGHMGFGLHTWIPGPSTYVVFLRHPVERVVSEFYYIHRTPAHWLHPLMMRRKMSLADYVRSGVTTATDNQCVRLLGAPEGLTDITDHPFSFPSGVPFGKCSRAMLETATRWCSSVRVVVGLTASFDEAIQRIRQRFGWGMTGYTSQNVSACPRPLATIPKADVAVIEQHNALDLELYQWAQKEIVV